ncbi:MAG: ShlB/FhaC/HecB family hemolysin secretion/activation protein [Methylococcales bacterium]|nr:ShlB/FhaC/HecB family hemolysin secretion/activation protein [Methylococcales bacterium]MDP3839440.1 ShlB/FhaC/HecB family hemolysin secretion/activation protein [Methylococcales bacterium]
MQLPPSAGAQIQQIPPTPIRERADPKFETQQTGVPVTPKPDGLKIIVKSLKISGAKAFSDAEMLAVTGFKPNSLLSLTDLRGMVTKIADFYHQNGYFVAQAYLPAQNIQSGVVTIAVIVGQYGNIKLNNQTNLNDNVANTILHGLNKGDRIESKSLEERLLLLSDLPGVKINSTLVPGASTGASDLNVNVTPGQRVTGSIDADNAGNRYTGMYRGGGTIYFNEPLGEGDVASLRVLTAGTGLNYGSAAYQMQFGKANAGVAYSYLNYQLGKDFKDLDAHGTAQIGSIYGNYPLIRSRNNNLYTQVAYDEKLFHDKTGVTAVVSDKRAHVLRNSLYGDHRDEFLGGGIDAYSLTLSSGFINLENPDVRTFDAATARTNGYYNKFSVYANRLQRINDDFSLFVSVNGQVASKNLDVSEKMELGGMYAVRAYPEGETYADQGAVFTLEGRANIPKFFNQLPGQMQLIGFLDTGIANIYQHSWASGSNTRTLSGAGGGATWLDVNNFALRVYYAHRLGNDKVLSGPDQSGQFWAQVVKYF